MEQEFIYIKGKASGLYKPSPRNHSGDFAFHAFDFKTIDVHETTVVPAFNFEQFKVGHFFATVRPQNDVRVFVNATEFVSQAVHPLLLTDIKPGKYRPVPYAVEPVAPASPIVTGTEAAPASNNLLYWDISEQQAFESIYLDGEGYHTFTATAYIKLSKPVAPKQALPLTNVRSWIPFGSRQPLVDSTSTGAITNPINLNADSEVLVKRSPRYDFFATLLGGAIISILGFLALFALMGAAPFAFALPLFFFINLFLSAWQGFRGANSGWHPRVSLTYLLGWLLFFMGLLACFQASTFLGPLFLLSLGAGLIMRSRTGRPQRLFGLGLLVLAIVSGVFLFKALNWNSIKQDEVVNYDDRDDEKWDYKPEERSEQVKRNDYDTLTMRFLKHNLEWQDNQLRPYQAMLEVRSDHVNIARIKRNQLEVPGSDFGSVYQQVFRQLVQQNANFIDSILGEYARIGKAKNLNRHDFAEMVVTSIQSIPYCLVHDLSHQEADRVYGGYIREYHATGKPCLANTKFGLQAPAEFMANFKGDCDTRSLFLCYALSRFGYATVLMASEHYGHAILGISGNYSGDYLTYNGLKYYVWETTAKGFEPGHISPECSNMRYWKILMLGNKNQ